MKFNLHSRKPIHNSLTSIWRRNISIQDMENLSHKFAYHLVSFLTFYEHNIRSSFQKLHHICTYSISLPFGSADKIQTSLTESVQVNPVLE